MKAVEKKEFREDLYYRLKGLMFHIPPLRERPEDIAPLVETFISEFSAEYGKNVTGLSREALTLLERAAWPGNIRQLRNTIQIAIALTTNSRLESKDFPDIYPEFVQALISIWRTLPPETQNAIWESLHPETQHIIRHELATQFQLPWHSLLTPNILKISETTEFLNIESMNQNQILRAVAQKRIQQYASSREAAESLNIDIRTLQRHACWKESDE